MGKPAMRAVSPSDGLGGRFSARRPRQRRPDRQPPARATEPGGRGCPQAHTPAGPARQQRRRRALHLHRPGPGPLPRGADTRRPRNPGHRPLLSKAKRRPALPRTAALGKTQSSAVPATVSCRLPKRSGDRPCPTPQPWAKPQAPQSDLLPSAAAAKTEPSLAPHVGSVPSPPPAVPATVPQLPKPKRRPALPRGPRAKPGPAPTATLCAPPQKPAACHIPATASPPGPRARLTPGTAWGNRARHPGNGVSLRALGPGNLPLSVSRS